MNLLPQQNSRKPALTEKQEVFLDALFDNGGNIRLQRRLLGTQKALSSGSKTG